MGQTLNYFFVLAFILLLFSCKEKEAKRINGLTASERVALHCYHELFPVYDGLMPYFDEVKMKWGCKDTSGKIVIPAVYTSIGLPYKNTIVVSKDTVYFLINEKGEKISADYSYISLFKSDVAIVQRNYKYGWINCRGEEIVSCIYDYIGAWGTFPARIGLRGYDGFVNSRGKVIIDPHFNTGFDNDVGDFYDATAFLWNDGKMALYDTSGKRLTDFLYTPVFDEGGWMHGDYFHVYRDTIKVFLNKSGKEVKGVEAAFINAAKRENNISEWKRFHFIEENKYDITGPHPKGVTSFERSHGEVYQNYVFANGDPAFINKMNFEYVEAYREGLMPVRIREKIGFVDYNGNLIIPPRYDEVKSFEGGLCYVIYKDAKGNPLREGFIDRTGKEYLWRHVEEKSDAFYLWDEY